MFKILVITLGAIALLASPICYADNSVKDLDKTPVAAHDAKNNLGGLLTSGSC